jgi:ribonucleoside-diphosphate reductase alpha chain
MTFRPEGFSETIFKDRYAFTKDESWEQACERIASQMALPELAEKQTIYKKIFTEILVNNYFVPGGRIWYNSGRNNPQLLNCFVLGDELDSKEGWGRLAYESIVTSMTGGGCGADFSDVRPRDAIINGHRGLAPGPVELMKLDDGTSNPIRAGGGRRVAKMYSLDLDHPNVDEFLDAKLAKGQLTSANVSVRCKNITGFIKAVKEDLDWELSWKGKYKKTIKAKVLWEKIVTNAYNCAEPGLLNWELVENESNIWYIEKLTTTNPCFSGLTLLKTENGYKPINSLLNQNIKLYNYKNELVNGKIWSNGVKPTVQVKFSNGEIIICTPNHRFMLNSGEEQQAINLRGKRVMPELDFRNDNDEFVKLGFIQGDGGLTRLNSPDHKGLEIHIGEDDNDIASLFDITPEEDRRSYYINGYNYILRDLKFDSSTLVTRKFPETFDSWNSKQQLSFVRGMYSANGCIIKNARISYKAVSLNLITKLSEFLDEIGITNYITTNKAKMVKFENGNYLCKQSYDLNIGTFEGSKLFAKHIGFVHQYKTDSLKRLIIEKSPMVVSVKKSNDEEVFDFALEDDTHWGLVGSGYVAHNCGEIALSPYDCCCLGHLVLPRFVFGSNVDWGLLADTIRTGVRFLDNVLSVNNYPLPEMKAKSHKLRRIGLGTTGLADTLALLGYKYGSEEGNKFVDKLYKFIAKVAYESSVMLAVEKGAFPACDPQKHVESGFMKRMPHKIKSLVKEHGIRNCCILTQAPTGTVSILSGNCSSGIEPIFSTAYERRYWDQDVRKTELVFHPLFAQFMEAGKDVSHFVSSHELSVRDHMEIQSIIQRWTDNAVSKTINMANDYPMEEMAQLWLEYLPKLKGTTFYRDGTRGFVKDDGTVELPPLTPLSIEEATKRYKEKHVVGSEQSMECPTGICSI